MNTGNMKNIVVLKDLPSNLVEEAIVFLKENNKSKNRELVDFQANKTELNQKIIKGQEYNKKYIIDEAKMLISEYITKIESGKKEKNISYKKLKKKYDRIKKVNIGLTILFIVSLLIP